jgi:hypothetical protein
VVSPEEGLQGGARRASWAALRVGQRLRKSQKMRVSLSWNHWSTWGNNFSAYW